MKIYKVIQERVVYIRAKSAKEAKEYAEHEEVHEPFVTRKITEEKDIKSIPRDWRHSIPYGFDWDGDATIEDYLTNNWVVKEHK